MPSEQSAGYLPGDPRYGLRGEALRLLPHQAGGVGNLLLGQAGDESRPAYPGGGAEHLRQKFR